MKACKMIVGILAIGLSAVCGNAFADSSDSYNIRFNPIAAAVGFFNGHFDYKVNDKWSVGPALGVVYLSLGDIKLNGYSLGLGAEYAINKIFDHGWVVDGGIGYSKFHAEDRHADSNADVSGADAFIAGGYHWYWGSTFNLMVGGGLSFNTIGKIEVKDSNGQVTESKTYSAVQPTVLAELGFTF